MFCFKLSILWHPSAYPTKIHVCHLLLNTKCFINVTSSPSSQLELVPGLEVWGAESGNQGALHTVDLPDFSFSPGEYITCVGEYLMTLPQVITMYNVCRIRAAYLAQHSKFT